MTDRINIIIVDDNKKYREDLKNYIENKLNFNVIAEASDGIEFLELPDLHLADIILMDIAMDIMDGFETTKRAVWNDPKVRIVALTMHIEKVFLLKLVESGFKGCVFKTNTYTELEKAIYTVMSGKLFFPKNLDIICNENIKKSTEE